MNLYSATQPKYRYTEKEKRANDNKYYRDKCDLLDHGGPMANGTFTGFGEGVSDYKRMHVNYRLMNNIIDMTDFTYVCQPFGAEVGDMPARLTNRDIVSGKIKVLLGMEMRMPFDWRPIAVNREATTRKEQEFFTRIKTYVESDIMRPIRLKIEQQSAEQLKGRELSPQERQQLEQDIAEQTKAQTPEEVIKYMAREHQDPAEIQYQQILEYGIQDQDIPAKFNKMFKHGLLSGLEVGYVGMLAKKPVFKVVNSLNFKYDKSPDVDDIADGEWATCEYRMTPSEVVSNFPTLDEEELDKIYAFHSNPSFGGPMDWSFNETDGDSMTIRVLHCTWKGLRKIGFLKYYDRNGKEQLKLVDENYKINKQQGDITVTWEWFPISEECYKIMSDIYVNPGPVIGQNFDLDNLYRCKLPYYGGSCDSLNAPMTAAMDRIKGYQYYFDIILYRIEMLLASDKGKLLAMNLNALPNSAGIDIQKMLYFMEANKLIVLNPAEEGNKGNVNGDITNLVKTIDMTLASNIQDYIQIAEYIERKCGDAIGVTKQMEGQIASNDAVTNTKQNLVQSSYIVQPYFDFHNNVKKSILQAYIDTAKAVYTLYPPESLSYTMDDMSVRMFKPDIKLLSSSTVGIYVANSTKAEEAKRAVQGLAQAALQNSQADLADVIRVIRADSITEAEELVTVAQTKRQELEQANEKAKQEHEQQMAEAQQENIEKGWAHEKDMMVTKENLVTHRELQKQAMLSVGFAEDKDADSDGTPDVLEIYKEGAKAQLGVAKHTLEVEKFQHQKKVDDKDDKNEKEKLKIMKNKPASK